MNKILVLGGGSWGTTLGNLLAEKDHEVFLWARNSKIFKKIKNNLINNQYLPKYKLSKNLIIVSDLKDAFKGADLVIIAIPSKGFRSISSKISKYLDNQKILIASKGIENKSFMTMSEVFIDETNYLKENPNALAEGVPRQEGARMHYASEFRHLDSKVGKMVRAYLKENPKDYSGARKIRNEHRERLQYLNHMAGSPFSD